MNLCNITYKANYKRLLWLLSCTPQNHGLNWPILTAIWTPVGLQCLPKIYKNSNTKLSLLFSRYEWTANNFLFVFKTLIIKVRIFEIFWMTHLFILKLYLIQHCSVVNIEFSNFNKSLIVHIILCVCYSI